MRRCLNEALKKIPTRSFMSAIFYFGESASKI
ncbi:hypothetical protein PLUTE_a6023 [Pseudoalteromonas luteoviolacea DSM 6061]|nr:hypothetical protein [Pseudoalteromonas luteoviolacea DSM 6061]